MEAKSEIQKKSKQPLTIEILRKFQGFENVSDEEAQEIVFSVQIFCSLLNEYMTAPSVQDNDSKDNLKQAA